MGGKRTECGGRGLQWEKAGDEGAMGRKRQREYNRSFHRADQSALSTKHLIEVQTGVYMDLHLDFTSVHILTTNMRQNSGLSQPRGICCGRGISGKRR